MAEVNRTCYVWGYAKNGRLGRGDEEDALMPVSTEALKNLPVSELSCGYDHAAALLEDGTVLTWGRGANGRLGHGNTDDVAEPKKLAALDGHKVVKVDCGYAHTVALTDKGELFAFGLDDNGRLGNGEPEEGDGEAPPEGDAPPAQDPNAKGILEPKLIDFNPAPAEQEEAEEETEPSKKMLVSVVAGHDHTMGLSDTGDVFSWGRGAQGRLGLDTREDKFSPAIVATLLHQKTTQIAAGNGFSAALTAAGEVYTWGRGAHGILGHGDDQPQLVPKLVVDLQGLRIIQICCGYNHCVALSATGVVYTWGWGDNGRLGHGTDEDQLTPKPVDALANVKITRVACGVSHTMAASELGHVYTFGNGYRGQLGLGDSNTCSIPTIVPGVKCTTVEAMSCGNGHSLVSCVTPIPKVEEAGEFPDMTAGGPTDIGHNLRSLRENLHKAWQVSASQRKSLMDKVTSGHAKHEAVQSKMVNMGKDLGDRMQGMQDEFFARIDAMHQGFDSSLSFIQSELDTQLTENGELMTALQRESAAEERFRVDFVAKWQEIQGQLEEQLPKLTELDSLRETLMLRAEEAGALKEEVDRTQMSLAQARGEKLDALTVKELDELHKRNEEAQKLIHDAKAAKKKKSKK